VNYERNKKGARFLKHSVQLRPVASVPIHGWHSLCPVKNKGGRSFDKIVDQNFPLFSLGKLHP